MSIIEVTGNPRHDQLVHLIAERGYMNIEELAQLLDVSTQTVRRDIRKLSEQGLITRHHGGAGRVSSVMNTALSNGNFRSPPRNGRSLRQSPITFPNAVPSLSPSVQP